MKLLPSDSVADGCLEGYSATGALIVRKSYTPVFKRLLGEEADDDRVTEWRMSAAGWNRMVKVQHWMANGAWVEGNA